MSIVVTAATGHLGRLVVESLLARGVPAGDIVATSRRPEALADFARRGVATRYADHDDPASLQEAFVGAEKVLLISGNEPGARLAQHRNVIEAARAAGVTLLAYTSIPHADRSTLLLAQDHRTTEAMIAESGVPHTFLRNGWYFENYTAQLSTHLEHGIVGAAGEGRISGAPRAEYAEAAAAVLATDGHAGAVYELGGDGFTMAEYAAALSAAVGRQISYTDVPQAQFEQILLAAGLPAPLAAALADADRGISEGELYVESSDLEKLIGRAPAPLSEALS
jgi:NAD(P)H dehydrogenase (quinone)